MILYKLSPLLSFGRDSEYLLQKEAVCFFVRTNGKARKISEGGRPWTYPYWNHLNFEM